MTRPPFRPRPAGGATPAVLVGPGDAPAPTAAERAEGLRAARLALAFVAAVRDAPHPATPASDAIAIRLLLSTAGEARAEGMAGFTGLAGLTGHQAMAVAAAAAEPATTLRAMVGGAQLAAARLGVRFAVTRRGGPPWIETRANLIVRDDADPLDDCARNAAPLDGAVPGEEDLAARFAALRAVLARGRLFAEDDPAWPAWRVEASVDRAPSDDASRLRCVVRAADAGGAVAAAAALAAERLAIAGGLDADRTVRFRTLALEPDGVCAAIAAAAR